MNALLALGLLAAAQGIDDIHRRIYDKAAGSVVAVRALAPLEIGRAHV